MYPTRAISQGLIQMSGGTGNFGSIYFQSDRRVRYDIPGAFTAQTEPQPLNQWVHIAISYDGSRVRMYANGILHGISDVRQITLNNVIQVGNGFEGLIDELSFYSRPLDSDEITAIAMADNGGKCPTPSLASLTIDRTVINGGQSLNGIVDIGTSASGSGVVVNLTSSDILVASVPTTITIPAGYSRQTFIITTSSVNYLSTISINASLSGVSKKVDLAVLPLQNCAALPNGLMALYKGEENAKDEVNDVGFTGTVVGDVNYAIGKNGQAFQFRGSASYVEIPKRNLGSAFTVEFWLYPTRAINQGLIQMSGGTGNFGFIYYQSDQRVRYDIPGAYTAQTEPLALNQWVHIAISYDGSRVRMYANGILQTISDVRRIIFNNSIQIGSGFEGLLDEVSLYNRSLAGEEIHSIFLTGNGGKCLIPALGSLTLSRSVVNGGEILTGTIDIGSPALTDGATVALSVSDPSIINVPVSVTVPAGSSRANFNITTVAVNASTTLSVTASLNSISKSVDLTVLKPEQCVSSVGGLASWYRGEGNEFDSVGGDSYNGTKVGEISYVTGKVGQAFQFNGGDSYIQTPTINPGSSYTLEFWVYPTRAIGQSLIQISSGPGNFGYVYLTDDLLRRLSQFHLIHGLTLDSPTRIIRFVFMQMVSCITSVTSGLSIFITVFS
jgi:hypothetical protein